MKYQFQFAGANVSRRSSAHKGRLRMVVLGAVLLVAALAYTNYLFNIFHLPFSRNKVVAVARPVAATAVAAAPVAPVAKESEKATTATAILKGATEAGIAAVGTAMTVTPNAVPAVPDAPATTPLVVTVTPIASAPAAPAPAAAPVAVPQVVSVTTIPASQVVTKPKPSASRPPLERTPQQRLMLAGQAAFQVTMDLATKYPDAYGFQASDVFEDAKLGDPMPIYTVEESDRAKYRRGEAVKPILKEAKQWAFPVTVNNRIACMVTVSYEHHDYVPGKGSKILGMAWDKITQKWPVEEGYHPCIVMNPDVPGYFFTIPELPEPNMTDIVRLFDFRLNLSPADVILASWR